MRRPSSSQPNPAAARAFARIGYKILVAKLYRYATHKLGLPAIDAQIVGLVEAIELVNMVILKILDGTLAWGLPEHATDAQVFHDVHGKMRGVLSALRRRGARAVYDDALDELADEGADAFARLSEERGLADLEQALEHDAEASAYLQKMRQSKERAQIADELGMTVEHAHVVHKRIIRAAEALYAAMNDDEDEPPSSGPRGSYHVETTEERRGAPHEPRRVAGRAGRRRR